MCGLIDCGMLKHMKILFVCQNLNSGGAEKVISILANHFIEKGEVDILMISKNSTTPFYYLDRRINLDSVYKFADKEKLSIFQKFRSIKKYIRKKQYDVVVPFLDFVTIYTYYACRSKNKIVVTERCDPSKSSFLEKVLKKHIYKNANGCVFQTEEAKDYYRSKYKHGIVIPNPVQLTVEKQFDYVNHSRKHEIVVVGSRKKEKNRELVYKAFAILKLNKDLDDFVLRIFGETTERDDRAILDALGIRNSVIFMGQCKDWQQQSIDTTAFVLSSNYEGMPNALLEAAALKIPCISTDCPVGGPRFILKNGERGMLVPVNDCDALANGLISLARNKTLQNKYSLANECTASEFDKKTICEKWDHFLKEIVYGGF